jgi:hypothetical protein
MHLASAVTDEPLAGRMVRDPRGEILTIIRSGVPDGANNKASST